jgi:hypothetical protein
MGRNRGRKRLQKQVYVQKPGTHGGNRSRGSRTSSNNKQHNREVVKGVAGAGGVV